MRWLVISLLLAALAPGTSDALDWSVYSRNPGDTSPPLDFLQLAITTTDSTRIAAWFLPPQDGVGAPRPGRSPGLLLLGREGETLADRLPMIEALVRRGFAVLALEHRGTGASAPFPADPRALVYREFLTDASSGYDILWRRPEVDTVRTAVLGTSRGAVLALALGGRRPEVRAVVAVGAPRSWKTYLKTLAELDPNRQAFVPKGWASRDDPDRVIRRFNGAICFITGEMDLETPAWMARELYEKYPRAKELWIPEDAGHGGETAPERTLGSVFYDRVAAFLHRELEKPPHRGWPTE